MAEHAAGTTGRTLPTVPGAIADPAAPNLPYSGLPQTDISIHPGGETGMTGSLYGSAGGAPPPAPGVPGDLVSTGPGGETGFTGSLYGAEPYTGGPTSDAPYEYNAPDPLRNRTLDEGGGEWNEWSGGAGGGYLSSSGILAPSHKKLIDGLYAGGRINY